MMPDGAFASRTMRTSEGALRGKRVEIPGSSILAVRVPLLQGEMMSQSPFTGLHSYQVGILRNESKPHLLSRAMYNLTFRPPD